MALLVPQADFAASTEVLEQALHLQDTTTHLFKHIKSMLLRYSYQSKQSREEEARDLTQICLMKALEKKHQYDVSQGAPAAWLHGFAVNVVKEHLRQAGRLRKQVTNSSEVLSGIRQAETENSMLEFQNEIVQSVMQRLSTEDQQLIQLYLNDEYTQSELAQTLQ
jgi:RNA polymerase sigma factor (sigma-70 family)